MAQEYQLKIKGGTGKYIYKTDNPSKVSIKSTQTGVIYAHRIGSCNVTVIDEQNSKNLAVVEVQVHLVDKLVFKHSRQELPVQTESTIQINAKNKFQQSFHNCSSILVVWQQIQSSQIFKIQERLKFDYKLGNQQTEFCEVRKIYGLENGFGKLTGRVSYEEHYQNEDTYNIESPEAMVQVYNLLTISGVTPYVSQKLENPKTIVSQDKNFIKSEYNKDQILIATYQNSLIVSVEGGPKSWYDSVYSHKRKLVWETTRMLEIEEIEQKQYEQNYQWRIKCIKPYMDSTGYDFTFKVNVYNEPNELLSNPGNATAQFEFSCQPPFKMNLDWVVDQKMYQSSMNTFKAFPVHSSLIKQHTTYYTNINDPHWIALNNQQLYVKSTILDQYNRVILGTEKLEINYETSDDKKIVYLITQIKNVPTIRETKLHLATGEVQLTAQIMRYDESNALNQIIKAELKNVLVNPFRSQPCNYSIYLNDKNSKVFEIQEGSGWFTITPDSIAHGLASLQDQELSKRKFSISPKNQGRYRVEINDNAFNQKQTCQVLISPVVKISLIGGGLLQINKKDQLSFKVFDQNQQEFDYLQIQHMDIQLKFDQEGIVSQYPLRQNLSQFQIQGISIGNVWASVEIADLRFGLIQSNQVKITVFPPIKLDPPTLLLMPEDQIYIKFIGGPMDYKKYGIRIHWKIHDEKIADFESKSQVVTANKIGTTYLTVSMMVDGNKNLTADTGSVEVQIPDGVEIINMVDRSLLINSLTKVIPVLTYRSKHFTDTLHNATYFFKSNYEEKYSLHGYKTSEVKIPTDYQSQPSKFGLARIPHKIEVSVRVQLKLQEYQISDLSTSAMFEVRDNWYVISQNFHCNFVGLDQKVLDEGHCNPYSNHGRAASEILVPINVQFEMKLSGITQFHSDSAYEYSCQGSPGVCDKKQNSNALTPIKIDLQPDGFLTSFDQEGEQAVVVKEINSNFQKVVLVVVAEVYSMFIDQQTNAYNMPLGSQVELRNVFQDKLGRHFITAPNNVVSYSSNPNIVSASIKNNGNDLVLTAVGTGRSLIMVGVANRTNIRDLFIVQVTSIIQPPSPIYVHMGGNVQFKTDDAAQLQLSEKQKARWFSKDQDIAIIDPYSGLATAIQEGSTSIFYNESNIHQASTLHVSKITHIEPVFESEPKKITNIAQFQEWYQELYQVEFRMFSKEGEEEFIPNLRKKQSLIDHNIHFDCNSKDSNWIQVMSKKTYMIQFEKQEVDVPNYPVCVIQVKKPDLYTPGKAPSSVNLQVTVSGQAKNEVLYHYSQTFSYPFLASFKVLEGDHFQFTRQNNTKSLILVGSISGMEIINPHDEIKIHKNYQTQYLQLDVTIEPSSSEFTQKRIQLTNKELNQDQYIYIDYFLESQGNYMSLGDLAIIILIIIVLFIMYCLYKASQQPQIQLPQQPYVGAARGPASHQSVYRSAQAPQQYMMSYPQRMAQQQYYPQQQFAPTQQPAYQWGPAQRAPQQAGVQPTAPASARRAGGYNY